MAEMLTTNIHTVVGRCVPLYGGSNRNILDLRLISLLIQINHIEEALHYGLRVPSTQRFGIESRKPRFDGLYTESK